MKLYNSQKQTEQIFVPLNNSEVSLYVCGITPYDTTHIGHAFTYVFFDTLRRYLESKSFKVNYTQNVTDIDDDILRKAKETGKNWQELGQLWTDIYLKDMTALNVLPPTSFIKATSVIRTIIKMVTKLIKADYAYEVQGTVYFDISKYPKYGHISHYSPAEMIYLSRERGADPSDPNKRNPLDFILWQKAKENEPVWASPWGEGRPGWHIECSSIIIQTLGEQIDIHGGGYDLIYPHHESESAQSETFTGKTPFVGIWMHTGMVGYQGEKMSKSLGNLVLISDLLKKYSANAIRWLLLDHHYREPWEFNEKELAIAENSINKVISSLNKPYLGGDEKNNFLETASALLEDDFNIPAVLKAVASLLKDNKLNYSFAEVKKTLEILGFTFG